MTKILVNPDELYDASATGMSQAVIDSSSGLVFVSGQVDWDHQNQVSDNTVPGQLKKALQNLEIALTAAGANVETILQMRVYIRGELEDHIAAAVPIIKNFLGDSRPALTGIGVASLASRATLVEVEAIAKQKSD